jgi:hypothetical protein
LPRARLRATGALRKVRITECEQDAHAVSGSFLPLRGCLRVGRPGGPTSSRAAPRIDRQSQDVGLAWQMAEPAEFVPSVRHRADRQARPGRRARMSGGSASCWSESHRQRNVCPRLGRSFAACVTVCWAFERPARFQQRRSGGGRRGKSGSGPSISASKFKEIAVTKVADSAQSNAMAEEPGITTDLFIDRAVSRGPLVSPCSFPLCIVPDKFKLPSSRTRGAEGP